MLAALESLDHLEHRIDRALLLLATGKTERASIDLEETIQRWPGSGRAHLVLGLVQESKGRLLVGIRSVSRAVRLDPRWMTPPRTPDEEIAVRTIRARREQLEARGLSVQSGLELGQLRAMMGDYHGALDAYTRVLTTRPEHPELLTAIGVALRVLGQAHESIDLHRRAIDIRPDFALAFNNLTSAHADLGHVEAARRAAARALDLKPDLGHANVSLGCALLEAGQLDEAIAKLEDAVFRTPSLSPSAAALLAWAALRAGDPNRALERARVGQIHPRAHHAPQLHLVESAARDALGDHDGATSARDRLWSMATRWIAPSSET